MSETPSENGQLDAADEPSMEDILASIRKIISDDDQGLELVETETPQSTSGLNSKGYASEALVTGSFGNVPNAPEPTPVADPFDENSVFNDLRGSNGMDDILANDFESDDELVDLDIEALLSQADAPLETLDDSLDEAPSEEAALTDILAMDIPEPEPELSIQPSENPAPETVLSIGGAQAFDNDTDSKESLETLLQADDATESDSLFDELEGLLTDEPESGDNIDLQQSDTSALEDVPEPIVERKERRGLIGAGLAAVGLGAKSRQKSETKAQDDVQETLSEITASDDAIMDDLLDTSADLDTSTDDELDAMLESLISDIEPEDSESLAEEMTPTEQLSEPFSAPDLSENVPGLQTNPDEIDLVKSLMADLSDPESQAQDNESLLDSAIANEDLTADLVDEEVPSLSDFNEAENVQSLEDDNLDLDIEALLNGDMDQVAVDNIITGSVEDVVSSETEFKGDNETDNILDDILDMSLEDELEAHEDDLESLLEIPELDEPSEDLEAVTLNDTSSSLEDDVFELTDDDMVPDMDAVLQDEAENIALNDVDKEEPEQTQAESSSQEGLVSDAPEETSSLLEIAMEAEKEAELLEAKPERELETESVLETVVEPIEAETVSGSDEKISGGTIAAASGLGLAAIAAASSGLLQPEETEAQITDQEVEAIDDEELSASAPEIHEISPEPEQIIQKETAPMPSAAAKSETILDEVTEISTAEAFASLNQVVEEKAIVAERGDRVGDLVMEALRPMLKEWLDENLKGIVERAVTKEVKRISSGK